jgi:hypothetical protein
MQLQFVVFSPGPAQVPFQVNSVRNVRHERFFETKRPAALVIFGEKPDRVTTSIGGVVIGAIVVDGPVHELQVAVGADIVDVKKITYAHLSEAQFNPAGGNFGRQIPRRPLLLHPFRGLRG